MIDVAHDGDHGRPRGEVFRPLFGLDRSRPRRVLLLAYRLEAKFARDQLDLVEVQALVDRDHEAQLFEREGDDLGGRHLQNVRKLGDGNELVHPNQCLLSLALLGLPLLLQLSEGGLVIATADALLGGPALDRRERTTDVRLHGFHVDLRALPLLPLLLVPAAVIGGFARGRGRDGARWRRRDTRRRGGNRFDARRRRALHPERDHRFRPGIARGFGLARGRLHRAARAHGSRRLDVRHGRFHEEGGSPFLQRRLRLEWLAGPLL